VPAVTKTHNVYYNARYHTTDSLHNVNEGNKSVVLLLSRSRTGYGVPNWKTKIRNHQDATSTLTGTYDSLSVSGRTKASIVYHWDSVNGWGGNLQEESVVGDLAGYLSSIGVSNFTWDSSVQGKAANKFLSAVRETVTRMSAPTFLGELKQTLRMLRHPAEALGQSCERYYQELRKRKLKEQRSRRRKGLPELPKDSPKWEWLNAAPGLWLEHSFGWLPLMMDIESAFDALDSLTEKERVVHISRSAMGSSLRSQLVARGNLVNGVQRIRYTSTDIKREQTTYRYRGDVVAQAATTYADKGARWGFTASEFIPTAWELLPWSFLVDYFASIGQYLDAEFADTSALKWTAMTRRRVRTAVRQLYIDRSATLATFPAAAKASLIEGNPSQAIYKRTTVLRQAGAVAVPQVVFTFAEQSSRHLANMSALLGMFAVNLRSQNPKRFNFRR